MIIPSGKHEGARSELVALKFPDYVQWYMENYRTSRLGRELIRLLAIFDAKPMVVSCYSCKRQATRATAYDDSSNLYFWCERCDPYGSGANQGKLTLIKTYAQALRHIDFTGQGHRGYKRAIIKELAIGKGLPARVSDMQAVKFFA